MQAALPAAFSSLLSFRSITFYASHDDDSEALLQQSLKIKIRNADCNEEKQLKQLIFTREWKEFNRLSWVVEVVSSSACRDDLLELSAAFKF